ncbi:MAG: sodium:proton antiporter [Clostridiales bacterium]|jgi:CPA1 family monovalent cation:H+ antiporter|nr:sodium:proton antiporter [Clostridiales bacterium]
MEVTIIVIGIILAIVISNVLGMIYPSLPLPLLQIAFGCLLRVTFLEDMPDLDPELFMVLIIAPLLFHEADESNKLSLWRVKKQVLFMAFLLVFITVFAIGFTLHTLFPQLPAAACYAMGAILGPTDAIAVTTLSSRMQCDVDVLNILKGEGLINDASGLIAFHFAVTALRTGEFSPAMALEQLLIVSAGGFAAGFLLSALGRWGAKMMKRLAIRHTATHVLVELAAPFLSYTLSEMAGVSGVIGAVTAGSRQTPHAPNGELLEAEIGNFKKNVWELLSFALNSIVFLLLGLQLPEIFIHVWGSSQPHDFLALAIVMAIVIVTLILFLVRFISVCFVAVNKQSNWTKQLKDLLFLTFSGVKGTVSLATAFALPLVYLDQSPFAERPLLLFMTAGVIILSLIVGFLLLPLLADPKRESMGSHSVQIEILDETIRQLRAESSGSPFLEALVTRYKSRINELRYMEYSKSKRNELFRMRLLMLRAERALLKKQYARKEINGQIYWHSRELILFIYHRAIRSEAVQAALLYFQVHACSRAARLPESDLKEQLNAVFTRNGLRVVRVLNQERDFISDGEIIDRLTQERMDLSKQMRAGFYINHGQPHDGYEEEILQGFYVERRVIHQFLERGAITPRQANDFRMVVNEMESFTLSGESEELITEI